MKELLLVVVVLLFVFGTCGFLSGVWYGQSRMLEETSISSVIQSGTPDQYPSDSGKNFFDGKYAAVF